MKIASLLIILFLRICITYSQSAFNGKDIIYQTYSQRWELDSIDKMGTFRLALYKSNYIAPVRVTNHVNKMPQSENSLYSATEPVNYDDVELEFQFSLKSKVLQSIINGKGDLWIAYTQVAHGQIYNADLSRVFREINYEPELIFKYPLKANFFNGNLESIGVAFNHQSNGGNFPLSRSWSRIIFDVTYKKDNWVISFRPWIRINEGDKIDADENPAITSYIGDGELNVFYTYKRHQFYSVITHPFTRLDRGGIQLNYIFPIKGLLRGHVQAFSGYGETLIDYNYNQTTVGVGVSFTNW